jgi:hypothetical protein
MLAFKKPSHFLVAQRMRLTLPLICLSISSLVAVAVSAYDQRFEEPTMGARLYVGNLSFNTTEESLKQVFGKAQGGRGETRD